MKKRLSIWFVITIVFSFSAWLCGLYLLQDNKNAEIICFGTFVIIIAGISRSLKKLPYK